MSKVTIIYWSGSGNTEQMANFIAEGAKEAGADVTVTQVSSASVDDAVNADVLVLGSPSMGMEVIEEAEMEPFVASLESVVKGKKVALFGSYGWGDGQWLREWKERMEGYGAVIVGEPHGVQGTPEGAECKAFGSEIAG
jgi:flavodoxin, short chain